jgi:hypothetical protein
MKTKFELQYSKYPFLAEYFSIMWDLRFSWRRRWQWCSELWCCADLHVNTNIPEKHTVSIFRAEVAVFHFPAWPLQPWRWRQYVSPKHWYLPMGLYSVTNQDIIICLTMFNLYWRCTFCLYIVQLDCKRLTYIYSRARFLNLVLTRPTVLFWYQIVLFSIFINYTSSSWHFMPVLTCKK